MRRLSLLLVVGAAAVAPWSLSHAQTPAQILTAGCADDAKKFCAGVPSGGGQIIACLKQNKSSLSDKCKQAAAQVSGATSGGTQPAAAAAPVTAPTVSATKTGARTAARPDPISS